MARADRRGAQLAFELPPELLERLRAHAAAERRTVAALLRGWIEAGLAGAFEASAEPTSALVGLANRVESLERDVALLRLGEVQRVPPRRRLAALPVEVDSPDRVTPGPSVEGEPLPLPERRLSPAEAAGLLTTSEVGKALGLASHSALTNWIAREARNNGTAEGRIYRGHRLRGKALLPGGQKPGWLWERA